MLNGQIDSSSYTLEALHDPRVLALLGKLTVEEDARLTKMYPQRIPTRVTVTLDDGRTLKTEGVSTHWMVYARNKKSLCLALREPRAIDIIRRLIPSAHIFVESFRPGVLEAMGLGPDVLLELNPRLVVIRISLAGVKPAPMHSARASAR